MSKKRIHEVDVDFAVISKFPQQHHTHEAAAIGQYVLYIPYHLHDDVENHLINRNSAIEYGLITSHNPDWCFVEYGTGTSQATSWDCLILLPED